MPEQSPPIFLKRLLKSIKKSVVLIILLGPALLLTFTFFLTPVGLTLLSAFTDMHETLDWNFVGLENFAKASGLDPRIPVVVTNTIIYVVFAMVITVGLALVIALVTTWMKESIGIFFRMLWFLPNLTPPVVYILLCSWFFNPTRYGFLNALLALFGLPPKAWLTDYALWIVTPVSSLIGLSICMTIFTSAIKAIPPDYITAARVDGASYLQICRYVIIPMIKWPIMFATAWHIPAHINSFQYIFLLTNGGPYYRSEVWALYAFHKAFEDFKFGYGASLVMVLVLINVVAIFIVWKVFGLHRMMEPSRVEV